MNPFLRLPIAQQVSFTARAVAQAQSANYHQGEDIRLHLVVRGHDGQPCLIANDLVAGQWGEELRLPLSPAEALAPRVGVAFTGEGIFVTPPGGEAVAFRPDRPIPQSLVLRRGPDIEIGEGEAVAPSEAAPIALEGDGVIEAAGTLPGTDRRLLILRLADAALEAALTAAPVPLRLGDGAAVPAMLCAFDAGEGQLGLLAAISDSEAVPTSAELLPPGLPPLRLTPPPGQRLAPHPLPAELLAKLQRHLAVARGPARADMERLLQRAFTGRDTLTWLSSPVRMAVTRLVLTGEGVLLQGTFSDPRGAVTAIRLRRGDAAVPLAWLDTAEAGFLARAALNGPLGEAWIEVALNTGETGTLPLPLAEPAEIPALRAILDGAGTIPSAQLDHAFDAVLGPPLLALHRRRLARPMAVQAHSFGTPPESPRASVVIPLHGRLDMLPVQMALFSGCDMAEDEVIFVLDDPPLRAAALAMAKSVWQCFGVPLRLILPAEQRGFGPASNLGLQHSRGQVVCFLNADAFPQATDWLTRLVAALDDATVGAAGARLLYPDGSLQHGGMTPEPAPDRAGWVFPEHPGKGLRPHAASPEPREVEAITGACLALRRDVAERLGGFDPDYVIGDFEDADLCARLRRDGLRCVVEDRATLVHLEGQFQGRATGGPGRWNLTLLNAWTYNRRWHAAA
ncbi:MAG: hypothetical protein JWR10_1895 [Rubritepida sp.]|nr:hypothetical protein [Rubritepida sp.]